MKPNLMILIDTGIVGGPGKGLFQFLREAGNNRLQYVLCNFLYNRPRSEEFIDTARRNQFNLRLIRQFCKFDPSPIWQAYKIASDEDCNLIQSHGYKSHLIAAIISRILHIPWIAMSHGWTTEDWKVRFYHSLDQILLKKAEVAVAVSPPLYSTISAWRGGDRRTELILNAVDDREIPGNLSGSEIRGKLGIPPTSLTIGCFGRLSPEKGQEVLLAAFKRLSAEFPDLKLIFAGDGPCSQALQRQTVRWGLDPAVYFAGHQSFLRGYYEAIDLLVLPSLSEGLPNVLLEAMALGKPAVATDVGAVKEVIRQDETGWIVPPGSEEDLYQCLRKVLLDRKLITETGHRARASLSPKFSPRMRTEKILSLYDEVLEHWAA